MFLKNQKNGLNNAIDFKKYKNKIILLLYLAIYIGCIWLYNKPYEDLRCCKDLRIHFKGLKRKRDIFWGHSVDFVFISFNYL
jgi:hypothetical protein